jgi:hypothetical protein
MPLFTRTCAALAALAAIGALPAPAAAEACGVDRMAVERRIAALEQSYSLVLSDISCDLPQLPAHLLMCDAAEAADDTLWRMGRLDDLAWVHAMENATGQQVDPSDPPRDTDFIATRDACTETACLCAVLVDHTNASLGGTSPYPQ